MNLKRCFLDELNYLKQLAAERSLHIPALDEFLSSSENDTDIEFLFEHFAFLMAKLRLNIDNAFPEITQNLLSRVWPTPLRPIPSTAIVQFEPNSGETYKLTKSSRLEAKTPNGEICTYQLARELTVLPYQILYCDLTNTPTNSTLTLKVQWLGDVTKTGEWKAVPLTLFLSPDKKLAGLLQLWFSQYLTQINLFSDEKNFLLSSQALTTWVPNEGNLVLPLDIPLFWRLQLLQESLHLSHVNDFITLDLSNELPDIKLDQDKCFILEFEFELPLLTDKVINSQVAFITNCVPVVNLYHHKPKIRDFSPKQSTYHYKDQDNNLVYQIYSIYSERSLKQGEGRGEFQHYLPVTQFATNNFQGQQIYYQSMLEPDVRGQVQLQLTFINSQGQRVVDFPHKAFFCDVQLTNGRKCDLLTIGDICIPTLDVAKSLSFSNITSPTQALPPIIDSHEHWPIISYLSLSPLFIKDLAAVKQLLMDLNYHQKINMPLQQQSERRINAIISLTTDAQDWIVQGVIKRGLGMKLTLDPSGFSDEGDMYQFGVMLANVLPFCMTKSNFLMIEIINHETGRLWSLLPIWGSRDSI